MEGQGVIQQADPFICLRDQSYGYLPRTKLMEVYLQDQILMKQPLTTRFLF